MEHHGEIIEVASGLMFPEGPIAMADGSVLLVEIRRGTLSRVHTDGRVEVVARPGGGPNGAAIGPDGACYICNNGGFVWHDRNGLAIPGEQPDDYGGGRIERVDLATGEVSVLYAECDGIGLRGPNDLVFDSSGGFWFTDLGKNRARDRDRTGVFYAQSDGSEIREMIFPLEAPNGIGLSPDQQYLYVAETPTGRLWRFTLDGPGRLAGDGDRKLMAQRPDFHMFDSLAVDAEGNICTATLRMGGITINSADGESVDFLPMPDPFTTNICFGGDDMRTAFVTLSGTGRLVRLNWPTAGLRLQYQR